MSEPSLAPIQTWLTAPMKHDVSEAIERLRRARDVQQIAVMPDVHLATDVCIGVVVATSRLIYPQAVGGDIGCGMPAVGFDVEAAALQDPGMAGQVLAGLGRAVPARRRNRRAAITPPPDMELVALSHPSLEAMGRNEGAIEFATIGSGNHFIELQSDEDGRLWLMVHSGSRGMGPAIRDHHLGHGEDVGGGLRALDATSDQGTRYLSDAAWARRFADASRRAMAIEVGTVMETTLRAHLCWDTVITTDHNHMSHERHGERELWVHRKGAMPARLGEGVVSHRTNEEVVGIRRPLPASILVAGARNQHYLQLWRPAAQGPPAVRADSWWPGHLRDRLIAAEECIADSSLSIGEIA